MDRAPASLETGPPGPHARPAAQVLADLGTRAGGLDRDEVADRRARHGPNRLPAPPATPALVRLLRQFHSALIYALLAAAVAAAAVGHGVDAAVILAVVLVNALVGFVQEGRAEQALAAVRRLVSPVAAVLRDGRRSGVDAEDLVPGDVVLLEAGDRVPADLRLLQARGLRVEESALTGESVPSLKQVEPVAPDAPLGDRACMAYSGTLVAAGQGTGVVVATGEATELGRIGRLLARVETLSTPLLRQVDRFGRHFAAAVVAGAGVVFAFATLARGWSWVDALMAVVAMAVGLIPEGLPAVITITLAIGVRRMAARRAVIRRLPAVETLGATTVICTDKTGTLTRNEMHACRVVTPGSVLEVEGSGYAPQGRLWSRDGGDDAQAIAATLPLLRCAVLCNDARLHADDGHRRVEGDPMEGALLALAEKAGLDPAHLRGEWARRDAIPFDAALRYMATLHHRPDGEAMVFVKGAPERLLALSDEDGAQLERWHRELAMAAARGQRVLAFAERPAAAGTSALDERDLDGGLRLLGMVGFEDPPRDEAREAIACCREAGIGVKMITGDHAATAAAIGAQLGLQADDRAVVEGATLDALSDESLGPVVRDATVFARTTPEHKLRIVQALQARGEVVAMTGDGVNDAPALRRADVGVAMGIKGTEAAKEAAEMVLLDDDFASIVHAVHEGRTVQDNVRKVIAWTLPTNGGEVLGLLTAIVAGVALPMSAVQILWINLVTSVTLGLALAFEPPEPGVMARRPRAASAPLLDGFTLWRVGLVSVLMGATTLLLYAEALSRGLPQEGARTLAVGAMVAMEIGYLFSIRALHRSSFTWQAARGTPAVLVAVGTLVLAQAAFTYLPAMNRWFGTAPLGLADLLRAAGAGLGLMLLLEAEKRLASRWLAPPSANAQFH